MKTSRINNLKKWAASQFQADQFASIGLLGDAIIFAARLPLALVVIGIFNR